ncbi:hypothetical protein [Homoserinimonas sp. A520]
MVVLSRDANCTRWATPTSVDDEESEGKAIVPTWLQGMNPQFGDRSPARALHEDSFDAARVLAAANAFVGA